MSSPPAQRTETSHSGSQRPFATAAATAAQAPVPQAIVSPLPRSHTRILIVRGFTTRMNSVLMRSGKIGAFSNSGPSRARSTASTRSQNTTQCGFPMSTQVMRRVRPAISAGQSTNLPPGSATVSGGISKDARPMWTLAEVTSPSVV